MPSLRAWSWGFSEMSEVDESGVPEGFQPVPGGLGFADNLQPFYRRIAADEVSFGLRVDRQHGNSMGICHGAVLMTLADIAAASGVNIARGELAGAPTINLSMDFVSAAHMGEWLQADVQLAQVKRRFGFSSGVIRAGERVVARFNGTFYFPDHDGLRRAGHKFAGPLQGPGESG